MDFFRRLISQTPRRLGILPGSFNPVTLAHLDLARSALQIVDEVVLVLPRVFPHKHYDGASFEQRIELLTNATAHDRRLSVATTDGGLFIEIAHECRTFFGEGVQLSFLCGRDAAERIANWDYGRSGAWQEMLREFDLLVAPRQGVYQPAEEELASFGNIPLDPACDAISATEVRRRLDAGESWEDLVPETIHHMVRQIYTPAKT